MKTINIKLDPKDFKTPNKKLRRAAKFLIKDINRHFKIDGWDLDFRYYKDEVFYLVFGHHLENYMLVEILKAGYSLTNGKNGNLIITKPKRKKKK